MSGVDIRVCFIGDSFTAGTGDPECLGWVGRVAADAVARGHNLTAYNLGIRRETSADILRRWQQECAPRALPGVDTRVVFSFGANDTALDRGQRRLTLDQSLTNARALLRAAREKYPLLLIGPPPVADGAHDERIGELVRELAEVALTENVPFLDVFTPLQKATRWREEVIANDGSHPRSGGYRELAALIINWPAWWFHPASTTAGQAIRGEYTVGVAESDSDIAACFPVMRQLRPQLIHDDFTARVRRQMSAGYRLVSLSEAGVVRAVAGYRISENLAWGRFLYVDDLVTDESRRSRGHGRALLAWLHDEARRQGCVQLHLDSGKRRVDAHRFYLREGFDDAGLHFAKTALAEERD